MKRLGIALLCAIIACISASAQKSEKKMMVLGVAFYNLENLFDTINSNGSYDKEFSPEGARQWNGDKYWKKIRNMSYAISQMTTKTTPMGPAIIGVSEIENKTVLDDLVRADAIKKWQLQVVHHDSPDRRGVDVGLLYNPRFFRLLNVTNHTLHIEGKPDFRTRDQMCVYGLLAGEKVAVIVNHWPSRLGGQEQSSYLREAAAALSKEIADSVWRKDPEVGIIILGDLNDDPHDKSCAKVLGAKKNAKDVDGEHGFYNPFWQVLDKGVGSLAYKGAWNLFDQIIISGNLLGKKQGGLKYWKCEVFNRDFLRDTEGNRQGYPRRTYASGVFLNGYSDHYPTEIFFTKEL